MKKHTIKKIHGVKVVESIAEKRKERERFPRPAVFRDKTKYSRKEKHRNVDH